MLNRLLDYLNLKKILLSDGADLDFSVAYLELGFGRGGEPAMYTSLERENKKVSQRHLHAQHNHAI